MLLLLPTIPCSRKIRSVCSNARAHNYPSDDRRKQNDQPYRSRCLIIHTMLSLLVHFSLKQRRARRLHAPSLTLLPSSLTPERSHHDPFGLGCLLLPPPRRCIRRGRGRPPLAAHYSEHTPWPLAGVHLQARRAKRTAERVCGTARAQRSRQRPRCLLLTQAADASPALSASVPERCPRRGLACRLSARRRAGLAAGQGHQGADGIPITVRGGRYFIYRPPPGRERVV